MPNDKRAPAVQAEDQTAVCNQDGCDGPAAFRFTWPGRDEAGVCKGHVEHLLAVAGAVSLQLQITPIPGPPPPERVDVEALDLGLRLLLADPDGALGGSSTEMIQDVLALAAERDLALDLSKGSTLALRGVLDDAKVMGADLSAARAEVRAFREATVQRTETKAHCLICGTGARMDDPDPAPHRDRCPMSGDIRAASQERPHADPPRQSREARRAD